MMQKNISIFHRLNVKTSAIGLFASAVYIFISFFGCNKDSRKDESAGEISWKVTFQDSSVLMSQIVFPNEKTGYVLALNTVAIDTLRGRQFVYFTVDSGKSWAKNACLFPSSEGGARKIMPLGSNSLIALHNHLYKSSDNGLNWKDITPSDIPLGFFDIHIIDSTKWIVANSSSISIITNNGNNWKQVFYEDYPAPFNHFEFPSKLVGYASGSSAIESQSLGFIAKTIDGGETWTWLKPEPWTSNKKTMPYINNIQFLTETLGFITTYVGEVFRTSDGGKSWELISKKRYIYQCFFVNEYLGYCTDENNIYYTMDAGNTWSIDYTYSKYSSNINIIEMFLLNASIGYAITYDSKILKKSNLIKF